MNGDEASAGADLPAGAAGVIHLVTAFIAPAGIGRA